MTDKKRKVRDEKRSKQKTEKSNKKWKKKSLNKNNKTDGRSKKKTGPRLPNALRKELDRVNPNNHQFDRGEEVEDEDILSDEDEMGNDVYEYEEGLPEEESKKNRRYDPVENYEYELPEEFKDEDVHSDEDDEFDGDSKKAKNRNAKIKKIVDDDADEEDDERHLRMLEGITGMPTEAFDGKKKKKNAVISEAYPESEYNPSRDVLDGDGQISIEDLLGSLHGTSVYSQLRKRTQQMEKKSAPLHAPLPKGVQDKIERQGAYELAKKDITKWEPLVKRNREAPTIIFDRDVNLGFSTVGAIASEFEPRTEFEKKMASLVYDDKVMEAHKEDGARLLELNKVSAKDIREKWNHIAKMRSLLFRHEVKLKRVKKIKSKVYRRLLKKDKLKSLSNGMHLDSEEAKEQAEKQEFKRAQERFTLKHKNHSKWARRKLERGLNMQDDGTREAIAEQLHLHTLLTRKMKSMKDSSSSDDSSDEDDENSADSDHENQLKILTKGKEKTLEILEGDDEVPNAGVLSLPFMVRGLKKRKDKAVEEAKLALQEYESSIRQLEDTGGAEDSKVGPVSGRRVFGASKAHGTEPNHKIRSDDSDDEFRDKEDDIGLDRENDLQKEANINSIIVSEDSEAQRDSMLKNLDDVMGDTGQKTTYEVAIFASGTWKKMKGQNEVNTDMKMSSKVAERAIHSQDTKEVSEESDVDVDGDGQMMDGILSSGPKSSYQLPSQEELIREAFAGDDVQEEFTKDKEELLNEENPEPEKPVSLPGWGQWTHIQRKKGAPSWMQEEYEIAKRKREEALKKRKDARLKHVIISEKLDKKAEKLHTKTLPYPFTSKEVFEQSMRMPMGPESNPATVVGALNRPEVVKKPGLIIKPVRYEDVDPYEREEHKMDRQKQKQKQKPRLKKHNGVKPVVAKS